MANSSNRYAAKLFSEHPISLWSLDDDVYYVSLIDEAGKDISSWNLTNCTISSEGLTLPDAPSPFDGTDEYYEIIGDYLEFATENGVIELKSDPIFTFNNISDILKTISLNFYLYQSSTKVLYYEFGIEYYNTEISQTVQILSNVDASPTKSWIRFLETFEINEFDADTCQIVLKIYVSSAGTSDEYGFVLNGLSIGQWSESFSSKSIGSSPEEIIINDYGTLNGISAQQYGPASDNAYYIVAEDNFLLAKNDALPMVYGSKNSTSIHPGINNAPSFIFPNKEMFSSSGKNNTYSLEFWLKIKPNTKEYRRIFGPILSDYGIYVSEGFITLLIGDQFQTHNIGEWNRPMLIHILYSPTNLAMLINGEQVISIDIDNIEFLEDEWFGFYSYSDIDVFDIDCISIFSYLIPTQVAKRRFVWGQGVESQETVDSSFNAESTSISFPNAKYSSNIIYPDKERWDAGYYNNLVATTSSVSVPQYTLPEVFLNRRSRSLWYEANKKVNQVEYPLNDHPKFFTFRPNLINNDTEWDINGTDWDQKSYLKFNTTNILSAPISAIYGVFETKEFVNTKRPLIHIVNSLNNQRFEINLSGNNILYEFNGQQIIDPIDSSEQEHIVVGFNIPIISEKFGYEFSSFFSSYEFLTIYVGGAPNTKTQSYETFEGKIYKVAFADYSNYDLISSHFSSNGIAIYDDDSFFSQHYSTYAVMPFIKYNRFFLDISISASWEEYYPLSYFANYAFDSNGSSYYGLDFLQFNIGYPSYRIENNETFSEPTWENYYDLEFYYSYPIRKNYEILDNSSITGYANYAALENNEITKTIVDTSESSVDIFATFQLVAEGANEPLNSFTYTKELEKDISVDPSLENTNDDPYRAYKTKFRIIDGTIIYPPKNIKFEDVALVIHFSINQDAILSSPLEIRDMEITSKTLNSSYPNFIGTRFGNDIYPYIKSGIYYNYKSKNPLLIYKKNSPYLYLTENSGIKLLSRPSFTEKEYGISVPINKNKQQDFYLAAAQLFLKSDINEQINAPFPVFELYSPEKTIEFIADLDDSELRYKLIARNKQTKQTETDIVFYQNGINVVNPFLIKDKWTSISFILKTPLNISENSGSINLFPGFYFNNISAYPAEAFDQIAAIVPNVWSSVLYKDLSGDLEDPLNIYDWQDWADKVWEEIFIAASENRYSLTPATIYSAYTGTNVNVVDDNSGIELINDDFVIFSEVVWSSIVGKPA